MTHNMKSISRLLCLATTLASLAVSAAQFTFYINIGDLEERGINIGDLEERGSLSFGLQETTAIDPEESPIPPNFPAAGIKYLYFQGHGEEDDPKSQADLAQCHKKFFPATQTAATWRLVSETSTSIAFQLADGTIPENATLQIRKESDTAATTIADGASFSVENGVSYLIEYAEAGATVLPAPPANSHALAIIAAKDSYSLDLPQAPEGFTTQVLTDTLKAFDQNGNSIEATLSITEAGVLTLNNDVPEDLATITFQYVFTNGTVSSDAASAIVSVSKAIAATLVSDKTVLIDPLSAGNEDTLSFQIEYALTTSDAKLNKPLPFSFTLPAWNTGDEKLLTIAETAITSTTDATASAGAIDLTEGTITVTETNATLLITIQASKQIKFGGPIYAAINDSPIAAPYLIVKGSQTLDFDGDGEITRDDATFFYNFASKSFNVLNHKQIMTFCSTKPETEKNAINALAYFKANLQSLDFDGDSEITRDDAMFFYNFASKSFNVLNYRQIMTFCSTKPETEENAKNALNLLKQLYNNFYGK